MADSMVTGRMSPAKKQAGNRILDGLGINASQAINQMYDYLIENRSLPFAHTTGKGPTKSQIANAMAYARSLHMPNAFSHMTDDQIKRERMRSRYGIEIGEQ